MSVLILKSFLTVKPFHLKCERLSYSHVFCWTNILFLSTDPECSVIGERVGDKATQRPARKIPCVLRDAVVTDLARSISIKDGECLVFIA